MSLRQRIGPGHPGRISDPHDSFAIAALAGASCAPDADLAGRSVLVRTHSQLSAVLALIELDGTARRLTICPPDLDPAHLPAICADAEIDAILHDGDVPDTLPSSVVRIAMDRPRAVPIRDGDRPTEWVMFTSGTTGRPKMVAHNLAALTGAIPAQAAGGESVVWSSFYDIRRYGGLQMLLRALLGEASMVLSDAQEPIADFLARAARAGVTNISGTPSHWRRALMSPALGQLRPRYVRLSGEIADQGVLDSLAAAFPGVPVGHAYASTEAGVGFDVSDGLAGFPAAYLDRDGEVRMKVEDGSLRIRSTRAASGYIGAAPRALTDADGFVDTQDMVEQRGERLYFTGRREGIINVGGLKVHPEEVEAVINRQPGVRMSRVFPRRSPIAGALVAAEVAPTS
ncbi:AMP-binding protein, partial [Caulobacter sp. S45]|uniref:AMP-binding protein n=1 Tax=Caulobacter sp. S45 TaxID=1641861 RepID=UPI00131A8576